MYRLRIFNHMPKKTGAFLALYLRWVVEMLNSIKYEASVKKKIIVVDDDDDCRYVLSNFLMKKDYEVICSDSAIVCELHKGSQSSCSKGEPCAHFILTDNRMPGMNGLMLLARQARGACKIPMEVKAVLSGDFSPDELAKAEEMGCKIFHKPYDFDEIFDWINLQESASLSHESGSENIDISQSDFFDQ